MSRALQTGGASRQGFTLIETIVALSAVALISIGLATIFDSVGKTVKGGKRVSLLNQYAGLIENQMRRDFSRMTRDGFLVIRQQYADRDQNGLFNPTNDSVLLFDGDANARPRRIDEVTFFANDNYTSTRQPVSPDVTVTSDTAMIYYGHGQRRREDSLGYDPSNAGNDPDIYLTPRVDDSNADDFTTREARLGAGNATNPNAFAKDWTLLRHSTLLVEPKSSQTQRIVNPVVFSDVTFDPTVATQRARLADNEFQIGLQPAARTIFRALNNYYPRFGGSPILARNTSRSFREMPRRPVLSSGLVDIARTNLAEIRSVVEMMGGRVRNPDGNGFQQEVRRTPIMPSRFDPDVDVRGDIALEDLFLNWTHSNPTFGYNSRNAANRGFNDPPRTTLTPDMDLDMMHLWMNQSFPGESSAGPRYGKAASSRPSLGNRAWREDPMGVRMRYEPRMPDFFSALGSDFNSTLERYDQLKLAGNGFIANCSEFAVDWSFGLTDPLTNELIWYGPASQYDSNNNGRIDGADRLASVPYPYYLDQSGIPQVLNYSKDVPYPTPTLVSAATPFNPAQYPRAAKFYVHNIHPRLIYGYSWNPTNPEYNILRSSFFGYNDPTYSQDVVRRPNAIASNLFPTTQVGPDGVFTTSVQYDQNRDGQIQESELRMGDPAAPSVPWAWPKLVRVTITLSDAFEKPHNESTFQFVFSLPQDPPIATNR